MALGAYLAIDPAPRTQARAARVAGPVAQPRCAPSNGEMRVLVLLAALSAVGAVPAQLTWSSRTTGNPPMRGINAMAYDSARQRIVMFGGEDQAGVFLADTWEYGGGAWQQVGAAGPTAREGHGMAYDSTRQQVVLFGGTDNAQFRNDTWSYTATAAFATTLPSSVAWRALMAKRF